MMFTRSLAAFAALAVAAPAQAWVTVHVEEGASRHVDSVETAHVETFGQGQTGSFTSTFGGSAVRATFSGFEAGQGGAFGGSGHAVVRGPAVIKLDRGVKYFGLQASALDGNNTLELFSGGRSLGFYNLVGYGSLSGRPTAAFVNIISDQAFDEVRFAQSAGRFEIDNVTVANVAGVPEPAAWGLMILGFGAVGMLLRAGRCRRRAQAAA